MDKETFLKNLKVVTDILESNEILYDILFDYRSKTNFKNIKILINNYVDDRTLISLFGSIDKVKDNFIQINYNDVPLIFVKATDTNWVNAFYYYSGEIISEAINKIANQMGLSYTDKGLYYTDTRTPILITNKVFEIFKFFELKNEAKNKSILTGFDTLKDVFEFIINSTYFNANIFTIDDIKKDDFLYEEKLVVYSLFIKSIEPFKNVPLSNCEYSSKMEYIDLIDLYFPEANFLKKYCEQNLEYLKKFVDKQK